MLICKCCGVENITGQWNDWCFECNPLRLRSERDALRGERDQLRAALRGVLPTAEAWHRRAFMDKCDHDENCYCDHEARSIAALQAAREALEPKPGED